MVSLAEIQTQLSKAHEMIDHIFIDLFPQYGFAVREAQVRLSHEMLDALNNRSIALTEAGVGIGKTYAYLVALIVHQICVPESWWVRTSYCHDSKFNMNTPMPVIISTSSIALQKAIMQEYVPFLSRILQENGIIANPLQCAIRKGKSNYVCEKLLRRRLIDTNLDQKNSKQREALLSLTSIYDLDRAQGLSAHDRKQVCVPQHCSRKCDEASICRFQRILQSSKSPTIFFQICNHNYLLADIIHRRTGKDPLLPNYKAIVIDEAHTLHDAALQMYGHILEKDDVLLMAEHVRSIKFCTRKLLKLVEQMVVAADAFFSALSENAEINLGEEIRRLEYAPVIDIKAKLFSLILSVKAIIELMDRNKPSSLISRLESLKNELYLFYRLDVPYIRYMEYTAEAKSITLCAVPLNLQKQFSDDLWSTPAPIILTSGTLAVNGNFNRTAGILGMEKSAVRRRITESTADSPFDYMNNCLLYLPTDLPFPDVDNPAYLDAAARKIADLIFATHGHTLVLFTSYKLMSEIGKRVQAYVLPYPLMIACKNDRQIIDSFKRAKNAVLFATGSCWEGVDFPGDMVSSLIITTLPFNVPDPLSEYEQSQYPTLADFISASVVPDMQRKLKQGFGRAIRTESDTCVVTILDPRARIGSKYHQAVLDALPKCGITGQFTGVSEFIQRVKPPEYLQDEGAKSE